jgi:CheY-like chemotaxis protein
MAIDVLRGSISSQTDKNINDLLNTMECSSSFMEHALDSYITVQQIEEKNFELRADVIDLQLFFSNAVKKLARTLEDTHGIKLVADVPSSFPCRIFGDEKQLRYILNNVVMHAARLTKDQIKLEVIGGYRTSDDEQKFEISVSILGKGKRITDIEKELFFTPYGMLFTGRIEKGSVEGLSLLISKEIIKLYGGLMTVFSRDSGTAYSFQLPFDIASSETELREKKAHDIFESSQTSSPSSLSDSSHAQWNLLSNGNAFGSSSNSGVGIKSPLNSLRLANGSLYFQPRSNSGGSCDSFIFDLNEMADDSASRHSFSSLNSCAKESTGEQLSDSKASSSSSLDMLDDYGLFDVDIDTTGSSAHQHTASTSPPRTTLPTVPENEPPEIAKAEEAKMNRFDQKPIQLDEQGDELSDLKVLVVDGKPSKSPRNAHLYIPLYYQCLPHLTVFELGSFVTNLITSCVADTPCNLKMLQWLLMLNSIKSVPAVNGYEAILAYERADSKFDLIFLDNTMPIMVSAVLLF